MSTASYKTQCPYCGVGCGLTVQVADGKVIKVKGDVSHPSSKGAVCLKPVYLPDSLRSPDRLTHPQMRLHTDWAFENVSWDRALNSAAHVVQRTIDLYGPEAVAFYGSGQFTTEAYYTVNKLAKGFIGTNNFEANSRLCMASAVVGYVSALGADGPPSSYEDIDVADCFFLIGTNTAACHPVLFNRIKTRKKKHKETTVIVVDPRRTATAKIADIHLALRPGTDVALLNGMMHVLLNEGLVDEAFIEQHTDNFDEVRETVRTYPPEVAARICDIPVEDLIAAARAFGKAHGTLSFWSMGLNQSTVGTKKNQAIINLHLATGKIGTPGNGPFSLTGQPNAMGGREAGGLAHLLPGYRAIKNAQHRAEVAAHWGIPVENINPEPGLPAVEMFEAVAAGKIKILWIAATNPMVSMPNVDLVENALRTAELVIVQDAYPNDTSQFAHIVLPAAQWAEQRGVMTNSERRLTYLPKMVEAPGEALPDWEIFTRFARAMGYDEAFPYQTAAEVFDEFAQLTAGQPCDYSNVSHAILQAQGPQQWPLVDGKSSIQLYTDLKFNTANGRAKFHVGRHTELAEITSHEYPMVLTTGRLRDQWHTMTRTGKAPQLMKADPDPFVELHPDDALRYRVQHDDLVCVNGERGTAIVKARVTPNIRVGTCFMPFHWGRTYGLYKSANNLTSEAVDPLSKEPEYHAPVNISPMLILQLPVTQEAEQIYA